MKKRLVVFGATGDLTSRFLVGALCELYQAGRLPEGFTLLGIARESWDAAGFRAHIGKRSDLLHRAVPEAILQSLDYLPADVSKPDELAAALGEVREPTIFYLALPPALFPPVVQALARLNLPLGSALVLEKPFGDDLPSARRLNMLLQEHFAEEMVFRIDSFLGEQTIHNLLGMRFTNRVFEGVWNREQIEEVEIRWDETLTLEGRAVYYDRAGALKDMIQNHLLQLMCVVAMEPPKSLSEHDFRTRKVELLSGVRRMSPEEVRQDTVRGRYSAGRIGERSVPPYREEPGVDPARETETFAAVRLYVDSPRWRGVPFILRTGKALREDRMEISIRFREAGGTLFPSGAKKLARNLLRLGLNPDTIALGVNISGRCDGCPPQYVELEKELVEQELSPYARLLLQVFEGRQSLFVRADEAEQSWEIVDPIMRCWAQGTVSLQEYPAGSDGIALPAAPGP